MGRLMHSICIFAVFGLLYITSSKAGVPRKPCQEVCKTKCEHGYVYDKDGCKTCKCKPKVQICPPVCAIYCKYGNVLDKHGCKTCKCNPKPKCGPICRLFCPNGFQLDKYLCPICRCKPPTKPVCPKVKCHHGFSQGKDKYGCTVCKFKLEH
eukprot:XP_011455705.1 PREDICTED: antistasin [Crassostrea gigas]